MLPERFVGVVSRTRLPNIVLTDQGTVFTGRVFRKVCEILGCGHITTPYHPQDNGVVERLHGTLKPMLAKACQEGVDWVRFIPLAPFALRHIVLNSSIFFLILYSQNPG